MFYLDPFGIILQGLLCPFEIPFNLEGLSPIHPAFWGELE